MSFSEDLNFSPRKQHWVVPLSCKNLNVWAIILLQTDLQDSAMLSDYVTVATFVNFITSSTSATGLLGVLRSTTLGLLSFGVLQVWFDEEADLDSNAVVFSCRTARGETFSGTSEEQLLQSKSDDNNQEHTKRDQDSHKQVTYHPFMNDGIS